MSMSIDPLYVQLTWEDPITGKVQRPILSPPIAIGRDTEQMPETVGDRTVSRLTLEHRQVSRFHASITLVNYQLYVTDRSANGTFLNGQLLRQGSQPFSAKDTLRIGPYKITASLVQGRDLDNATELTVHDQGNLSHRSELPNRNTLLVWLVGAGVMLMMAAGAWWLVSDVLTRSRPRVPDAESKVQNL